jgi:hypothetical protein
LLKPLAAGIGDPTLDFRKLRRSHSTFYAVLNVHPPAWRVCSFLFPSYSRHAPFKE